MDAAHARIVYDTDIAVDANPIEQRPLQKKKIWQTNSMPAGEHSSNELDVKGFYARQNRLPNTLSGPKSELAHLP